MDEQATTAEARRFFELIHGTCTGWTEIRCFGEDGPPEQAFTDSLDHACEIVGERLVRNVYTGVARRRSHPSELGHVDVAPGGKGNLAEVEVIWIDKDLDSEEGEREAFETQLDEFLYPPSMVVWSGGGFHVYWRLEEPLDVSSREGVERLERILKGLADYFEADRAATDASRVLRVPGTTNHPDAKKRARGRTPCECVIERYEPDKRYDIDDFADFEVRAESASPSSAVPSYVSERRQGDLPAHVLRLLAEPAAARRWEGDTEGLKDTSDSGIDMWLARHLVDGLAHERDTDAPGFLDSIGNDAEHALRKGRELRGAQDKHDGYYALTVGKAIDEILVRRESRSRDHAEWPDLVPLDQTQGPPFPVDALPGPLQQYVAAVAEATQTPADLSGTLVLAVAATAVAGKAQIKIRPQYLEPLNLYVLVAQPPASRKSEVFRRCAGPIVEFERDAIQAAEPEIARAEQVVKTLRERLKSTSRKAGKADEDSREALETEALELSEQLQQAEQAVPQRPRLTCADVTPEELASLMKESGDKMALLSAEGGEVFEMMMGRYAKNGRANCEIYLKAHAGDPVRVDRRTAPPISMDRPALTIALAVQPQVLEDLSGAQGLRGRGLIGRFLYSLPENLLGRRSGNPAPVPLDVEHEYRQTIGRLLDLPSESRVLKLSREAYDVWYEFERWIEPQLADGAAFSSYTDWAGKLAGAVARIAGLLHLAASPAPLLALDEPIGPDTMRSAVQLGRYFLDHVTVALSIMSADVDLLRAQKIWRYVERNGISEIREAALFRGVQHGRIKNMEDLHAGLQVLVDRGYMRRRPREDRGGKPGRPPSDLWEVLPGLS